MAEIEGANEYLRFLNQVKARIRAAYACGARALNCEMLKAPYASDLLEIDQFVKALVLKRALLDRLCDYLLGLGKGFALLGNHYRREFANPELLPDLLFYYRFLRSLIAVELRIGEFEPKGAEEMRFTLDVLDAKVKLPKENRSLGFVLYKAEDNIRVEYPLPESGARISGNQCHFTHQLPDELKGLLPGVGELEQHLRIVETDSTQ